MLQSFVGGRETDNMDGNYSRISTEDRVDDVVHGLPVQQYAQEQPLPSEYTYPAHPGTGVRPTGDLQNITGVQTTGGYQNTTGEQTTSDHPNITGVQNVSSSHVQPQPVADHSGVATGQLDSQDGSSSPVDLSPPSSYLALSICSLFWCFVIGIFAVIASGTYQQIDIITYSMCLRTKLESVSPTGDI